jgi:hypothetical protein
MILLRLEAEVNERHRDYTKTFARLYTAVQRCGSPSKDDSPLQRDARNAARALAERWELLQAAEHALAKARDDVFGAASGI